MKLTCPHCDAEHDLPHSRSDMLQNNMQCSRCHHHFLLDGNGSQPVTDTTKSVRRIVVLPSTMINEKLLKNDPARPDLRKKAQMLVADQPHDANKGEIPTPVVDTELISIDSELSVKKLSDEAIEFVSMDDEDRLHVQRQPSTIRDNWLNIAAVIGAIMIFGGGLVVRDRVVSVIPSLASLYKLAGINVNSRGLEFASVKTKTELKNDGSVLVVEGIIKNISGDSVDIPAVRLLMRAAGKQELYAWFHEPDQMRLEAGETIVFSTRLNSPPLDVRDIHLKFTDRRKQQAKLN